MSEKNKSRELINYFNGISMWIDVTLKTLNILKSKKIYKRRIKNYKNNIIHGLKTRVFIITHKVINDETIKMEYPFARKEMRSIEGMATQIGERVEMLDRVNKEKYEALIDDMIKTCNTMKRRISNIIKI